MILLFGGTTEGRQVAEFFDIIGQPYFYSTKTESGQSVGGRKITGAMDAGRIISFCREKDIRLIIDAAHPFAVVLHQNIHEAAKTCGIKTLRIERPAVDVNEGGVVRFFDDYPSMCAALQESNFRNILALTGVQTILHFRPVWETRNCFFRILDSALSRRKAMDYGIPERLVFPMNPHGDDHAIIELCRQTGAEVLLTKDSGSSGFFESKIRVASQLNIPLWGIRRPRLPRFSYTVFSRKEFLKRFFLMRKELMVNKTSLRSGFTTGTCLAAAVRACFLALARGAFPDRVSVILPDGGRVLFPVFPVCLEKDKASCVVIKDAGDDADVIHGHEIGCELAFSSSPGIRFLQGHGVGRVTLPGLQVSVGEPAINPVPRQVIKNLLENLAEEYDMETAFDVKAFVPEGEELARKTFNPRVGVEGGISIIGTSGRVIPFSSDAFLASIRHQLSVAINTGCREVVLTSGKRSENLIRKDFAHLPDSAFVHYGNLIGKTIELSVAQGATQITLALMFAKSTKLAAGHLNTHSKHCSFDPDFVADIAKKCGYDNDVVTQIRQLPLANSIMEILPFYRREPLYEVIEQKCRQVCLKLIPKDTGFNLILLSQ
jgi:cobalt-precorrin-5B (C1)-methyltransferase